jgi:hypothetical protein
LIIFNKNYTLSRETGDIRASAGSNTQSTIDWISGPNAKVIGMSDPAPLVNQGKDTFAVRIVCPIIDMTTKNREAIDSLIKEVSKFKVD